MKTVFIDGKAGTTGLRIYERLSERDDVELILLSDDERKNPERRKEALNSADTAFLCLPDDAAREAVSMVTNPNTVVIDTSTAHRTANGWAYGFPELGKEYYEKIAHGKRIAVPGCHAGGFVALVHPLTEAGILPRSARLTCFSVTGYSGGGKKMIAEYESSERAEVLSAPRQYGLSQSHKHLPEMTALTHLETPPIFCPIVSDYYSGMTVTVPLFASELGGASADDVRRVYSEKYGNGEIVSFVDAVDENGFVSGNAMKGLDAMRVTVAGNGERLLLIAAFDNLGKGASGAAIECFNISSGQTITKGLCL